MVGHGGAMGSASWAMSTEVLPISVRSFGVSFSTSAFSFSAFLIILTFNNGEPSIGLPWAFLVYSMGSVGQGVLIMIFAPETHGRSLADIENYWDAYN
ncbi:Solute carrier family 2 facilitated glucose transporter member 10-like [Homarus americanus]|uniref:Solute carrier family 2 facilitated glucose transporter member 10-like n=1 Tax=Homarus americanus TaxID=6706 RepID=A0A8J5MHG4_HOMAM|nr:Solute carrier family 2 facilitated glucose transporter member 10-like [Homarus americanus]